jgi:ketosteroid isomerase-like protein
MRIAHLAFIALLALLSACAATPPKGDPAELKRQVADTERAFARSMAERNHAAFSNLISEEAVFFGSNRVLRGKQQVADAWKSFFVKPDAPFSWEPVDVEVLDSGTLALSSGPVRDPKGKVIATYTSIWRLEAPGTWRIIFDKGNDVCDCAKP